MSLLGGHLLPCGGWKGWEMALSGYHYVRHRVRAIQESGYAEKGCI